MKQENSPCYDSHSSSPLAMGHLLLLPCFIEKGILYREFFFLKKNLGCGAQYYTIYSEWTIIRVNNKRKWYNSWENHYKQ